MRTKQYYISALLVWVFIGPMWSAVYGSFEPKQPPITDPYNPQPYMLELAEQLTPEQAEILLRGIYIQRTTPTTPQDRAVPLVPRLRPMPQEYRAATVVSRPTPTPKQYTAPTVPQVSEKDSRIYVPPRPKARSKSTEHRVTYRTPDSRRILQVHCSDIQEDELSEALKKGDLCLVRLSDDPRIYAIRAPKSAYEPTYCSPVVADAAGRKYLLFSSSDIALTELVQALGRHPSDFSLIKEYDPSHPISSTTSVCSVVSDKLGQLLDFLASGFERDQQEP